jgi:DNA-binding NtrC family response regulator
MVLADFFAKKYAHANGVDERPFTPEAVSRLKAHGWRGNVRELENAIHRAILLAQGDEIDADAIMLNLGGSAAQPEGATGTSGASGGAMVGKTVAEVERDLIIETLHHCLGNRTHAANILGISIRTLRNKLRQYTQEGIAVPMPGEA